MQGGAELAPFLAARGRFFPGGHCPTVGLGGFLLQGGQGWNARGWGWAAEYVEAIDVVTADGELVRARPTENADLYWAARGAGPGFFGVVTRFHLRTLPAPAHVAQTVQAFHLDDFDEVMTWLHEMHATVADTVEIVALTKTDRDDLDRSGAAGDRRRAGRLGRGGGRRAGAVPHQPGARPGAAGGRRRAHHPGRAAQAAARTTTRRDTAGRSTTPGCPARLDQVVPAMRRAYTTLPNEKAFTIWFSMAPLRQLPDMAFSLQSEIYLASYVRGSRRATTSAARPGSRRRWPTWSR